MVAAISTCLSLENHPQVPAKMDVKKGLRNPLEEAQVRKAVLALQAFVDKQKAALPKKPLVDSVEYVQAIITRKLIPAKGSNKPIQM